MERRGFLLGALLGVAVGGGVAWLSSYLREEAELANAAARVAQAEEDLVEAAAQANDLAERARRKLEEGGGSAPEPADPSIPPKIGPLDPDGRLLSFAQQGEDLVLKGVLAELGYDKPTYLDIGSYHPVVSNNTYLLYAVGGRGVLVEPNPFLAEMSRRVRPDDTMVEAGVAAAEERAEADYYVIQGRPQLNTFSKEQADRYIAEGGKIEKTVKMPLIPIDELLAEHFPESPPDLLSLDVEGLDLEVLRSMDFERWRPPVICVETLVYGSKALVPEIFDVLRERGYVVRGATFVNTIFVDAKRLREPGQDDAKIGVG